MVKNLPAMQEFNPWVGKIPWRRETLPTPVFLPGEAYGQRTLAGPNPWDCIKILVASYLMEAGRKRA